MARRPPPAAVDHHRGELAKPVGFVLMLIGGLDLLQLVMMKVGEFWHFAQGWWAAL